MATLNEKSGQYEGKNSFWANTLKNLSMGGLSYAQSTTGQPYLTNYQQQKQFEAEQAFKQSVAEQTAVNQKNELKIKLQDQILKRAMMGKLKDVYSVDPSTGSLMQIGSVPKGSQVIPPASLVTQSEKDISSQNVKREIYTKDLGTFLAVDDVLQQARGQGLGRLAAGGKMTWEGFTQDTKLGQAVSSHDAARKRLRVQLVRAAGDVGNINIVEQKAAEMMIPTQWDAAETAKLKRAYLEQIGQAINSNDGNAVKEILGKFMQTPAWQESLVPIKYNGKTYNIPKDQVSEFKKAKGIK